MSALKSDLYCLTGLLRDKEIVTRYGLRIATIRNWKNKTLDDCDSWRRICYELMVRYVPEKDFYLKKDMINLRLEVKKNLTAFEIGEKEYNTFKSSPKDYKLFVINIIENTPSDVLNNRILFLKECIDSIDNRLIKNLYGNIGIKQNS